MHKLATENYSPIANLINLTLQARFVKNMKTNIKTILKNSSSKIDVLDAELIIAYVLKKPREFVIAHPEYKISETQKKKISLHIKKRAKGYPLAYITGKKEFYGLDFLVDSSTLVPRPETELMVELALNKIKKTKPDAIIDIGTGNGCIPISIAKNLKKNKTIKFFASDISKKALRIAKKNAKAHKIKINFIHGSLFEPFLKNKAVKAKKGITITANLPYLTRNEFDSEPSIQKEPVSALVAKEGGLELYFKLLNQAKKFGSNKKITIFMEINPAQTKVLIHHIKKELKNPKVVTHKDLFGQNRIIEVNLRSE